MGAEPAARPCRHCALPVRPGATRCPHCRGEQVRTPLWRRPLSWVAVATTVLSLVFSGQRLYRAWSSSRETDRRIAEKVAAARGMAAAGDLVAAWGLLEAAQALDAAAPEIREPQIELVTAWLASAGAPASWVPHGADRSRPATALTAGALTPGAIADKVLAPLLLMATRADGAGRADLLALAAWCRFLRGRELLGRRRDILADLEAAQACDPSAYFPNLYLGFWHAAMRDDPAAAAAPWSRARAGAGSRDRVRQLRGVQLGALSERVAFPRESEEVADRAARASYLGVLDDMRRAGESPVGMVELDTVRRLFLDSRFRFDRCAELLAVRPAPAVLALLDWAEDAYADAVDSFTTASLQLVRCRVHEERGEVDAARQAIASAREEPSLRTTPLVVEAWLRLSGEGPEPAGGWEAHVRDLREAPLDSSAFEAGLAAIERAGMLPTGASNVHGLDAADAAIERLESAPGRDAFAARLRAVHLVRGQLLLRRRRFAEGIAELERLLRDPGLTAEERQRVNLELAVGYARSPRAPEAGDALGDAELAQARIYWQEGLDRLAAALDAGWTDWDWIEDRLAVLRRLGPAYALLSLRHGRTPPRETDR